MVSGHKLSSGIFGFARDQAVENAMSPNSGTKGGPRKNVMWSRSAGTVSPERLPPVIECKSPRIDHSHSVGIKSFFIRAKAPDATAIHAPWTMHRIHKGVDVD